MRGMAGMCIGLCVCLGFWLVTAAAEAAGLRCARVVSGVCPVCVCVSLLHQSVSSVGRSVGGLSEVGRQSTLREEGRYRLSAASVVARPQADQFGTSGSVCGRGSVTCICRMGLEWTLSVVRGNPPKPKPNRVREELG